MKNIQIFFAYFFIGIFFLLSIFIAIIPFLILKLVFLKKAADWWAKVNGHLLCRTVFFLLGVTVIDYSEEKYNFKGKKVCFISNHTSMLDVPAMGIPLHLWCGFIVKQEFKKVPFLNLWCWMLRCTYIKRDDLRASAKSIRKGIETIKEGWPMAIFPEGTRSKNGKIAPFKAGSFKLATKSGALVVPIAVKGIRAGLEDKKRGYKRVYAGIMMGKPIDTTGMDFDEKADLPERVEKIIHNMYDNMELKNGKK